MKKTIPRKRALLLLYLQANWLSGCQTHGKPTQDEEKCMRDLMLISSNEATGELINRVILFLCNVMSRHNNSKLHL